MPSPLTKGDRKGSRSSNKRHVKGQSSCKDVPGSSSSRCKTCGSKPRSCRTSSLRVEKGGVALLVPGKKFRSLSVVLLLLVSCNDEKSLFVPAERRMSDKRQKMGQETR